MRTFLQFALLGLGGGAAFALLASGIVLIFRGSGTINLANGAFAMLGAFLFNEFHANRGWPVIVAVTVVLLILGAIGAAVDIGPMRLLRRGASPLRRLIATLAVFLIIYSVGVLTWGAGGAQVRPMFPRRALSVGGLAIPSDRLWMLAVAGCLALLLMCVMRFTRAGWVAEAVAENTRSAAAQGWSPDAVSTITWSLGASLAALAGILIAPLTQLNVDTLSLLLVPALAAALVGSFRSFGLAFAGAIGLGVAQSVSRYYVEITGLADALPLVLIVLVLVARGSTLPLRGDIFARLGRVGDGSVSAGQVLVWSGITIAVLLHLPTLWLNAFSTTFAVAILLLSLVVLVGYAGQLSLGQYALAGMAALVTARLMAEGGWPIVMAAPVGVLASTGVGLVFALPALRTRGANLAVVTLGLAFSLYAVIFNNATMTGSSYFSGHATLVPPVNLFGWRFDNLTHNHRWAIVAFLLFVLCALCVSNLRRSRAGRRMLAIRSNERAASALGVNVFSTKLYAFAVSGALAGVGGILIAFQSPAVSFDRFNPFNSIQAIAWSVTGGVGYVLSSIFGGSLAPGSFGTVVALTWPGITTYLPLIGGIALLVVLVAAPDGFVPLLSAAAKPPAELDSRSVHDEVWYRSLARQVFLAILVVIPFGVLALRLITARRKQRARGASEIAGDKLAERGNANEGANSPERLEGCTNWKFSSHVRVVPKALTIEGLSVRYGGVLAVDSVSLEVSPRTVTGLIGPNGAGKTSLMDAITGFALYSGSVSLDGVSIDSKSPSARARLGMVRSFQQLELFDDLTVRENLLVAAEGDYSKRLVRDLVRPGQAELTSAARSAIEEFRLIDALERLPADLPFGSRRLLAVARAVAMEPSVLLLDEPVAGLDEREAAEFATLVRRLADDLGMAILVIEHDMRFVMGLCDYVVVLDFGAQIAEGTPAEVRSNAAAISAYIGGDPEAFSGTANNSGTVGAVVERGALEARQ